MTGFPARARAVPGAFQHVRLSVRAHIITTKALDALAGSTTTANFFTTPGDLHNRLAALR